MLRPPAAAAGLPSYATPSQREEPTLCGKRASRHKAPKTLSVLSQAVQPANRVSLCAMHSLETPRVNQGVMNAIAVVRARKSKQPSKQQDGPRGARCPRSRRPRPSYQTRRGRRRTCTAGDNTTREQARESRARRVAIVSTVRARLCRTRQAAHTLSLPLPLLCYFRIVAGSPCSHTALALLQRLSSSRPTLSWQGGAPLARCRLRNYE